MPWRALAATRYTDPMHLTAVSRKIRGKALILWDPKRPGKKRDAIDTDQITPAEDLSLIHI